MHRRRKCADCGKPLGATVGKCYECGGEHPRLSTRERLENWKQIAYLTRLPIESVAEAIDESVERRGDE